MRTAGLVLGAVLLVGGCTAGPGPSTGASVAASASPAAATALPSLSAASPSAATLPSATPGTSVDIEHPVGLIAIGHSGLTGEGTLEGSAPNPTQSYATGDDPTIDSIYERMVAIWPLTEGHVANRAVGGAEVTALPGMARNALELVPAPAVAIISAIDNDIRCDGTDADNVKSFGTVVDETLGIIHAASPNTEIVLVGQLGRPDPAYLAKLIKAVPAAKDFLTGGGMCDFYDASGKLDMGHLQTLTGIIQAYEDEQARVCDLEPHCRTDGGVRAAWVDQVDYFAPPEYSHLNAKGQAAEAENLWPVIEAISRP